MKLPPLVLYLVAVFLLSLSIRLYVVERTPGYDKHIDLTIYRNSGQLIVNHINPYDYNDGVEARQKLRTNNDAYDPWVSETQERWNYYAGSNLPLTVLILGTIEHAWQLMHPEGPRYASARFYRYTFAVFDSLLAVMIALYILKYWIGSGPVQKQLAIAGLGVLNPIMLYQGALIPEEKGLQVLFMLAALYFAKSSHSHRRVALSALFAGASIAYKGIGIFILPLVYYYCAVLNRCPVPGKGDGVKRTGIFVFWLSFLLISTCLPFASGLASMMATRLSGNLAIASVGHASIWRYFLHTLPDHWPTLRYVAIGGYLVAFLWLVFYRKAYRDEAFAAIVFLFTNVILLAGSLDRMNIGILFCLVVLSCNNKYREAFYYFLLAGGLVVATHLAVMRGVVLRLPLLPQVALVDEEYRNCLFALGFALLHILGLYRTCREERGGSGVGAA